MILNAEELRRLREELCLTRKDMAKRLGVARHYYSDIERGAKPIPAKWIDGRIWLLRNYTEVE